MHDRKSVLALVGVSVGAAAQPVSANALSPIVARPATAALREVNFTVSSKITQRQDAARIGTTLPNVTRSAECGDASAA
jgi:hypothetical protein